MLDLTKLPPQVLDDLKAGWDYAAKPPARQAQIIKNIEDLSVEEAFESFLRYNGIIGFSFKIISALDGIRAAVKSK